VAIPRILYLLPSLVLGIAVATFALVESRAHAQNEAGIDFSQPHHYVTREMELESEAMKNRRVPDEVVPTNLGRAFHIGADGGLRPQFVLFIKQGCVCSIDAQPFFNRMARKFSGKIDFVGVIDADAGAAKAYASQFLVAFPVVGDSTLDLIHGFKAQAAVYSALVARNGHIVKMWPGYNADMLGEMNRVLSEAVGVKETPFAPEYAPLRKTTGCAFSS